jgi:serine/threonine protein phosphatase 1
MTETAARDLHRIYVIGDIHGRLDLLDHIIAQIERDMAEHQGADCITITLGDYVDRGPDSRGVLDRLVQNPFPGRYVALKGNHESLLEQFLANPAIGTHWRRLGGLETLHSYGVPLDALMLGKGYEEAADALRTAIPQAQYQFLSSLKLSMTIGNFFLCHAGIRPGIALERQSNEDLLWIREEFLTSTLDFGKVVIHGHTPMEWPDVQPNRINIDTGAFATGRLTCLVLEGDRHRFLFTG